MSFSELKKEKEIIRFEIRINHKQKLNKLLQDLGYDKNPAFKDVFSEEMSKKVVTSYWDKIIKDCNYGTFSVSLTLKDVLQRLLLADNKLKTKQAVYLLGLYSLAKDENGLRQLRSIISKRSHDRTWYRIISDIKQANELINKDNLRDWVMQIDQVLEAYKVYKI